ncbi:hypothetical protein GCM10009817_39680 [Terrabacter lapilli]|uniref:CCHC-type domain-containing protein n=1 Tax=Terrabacter lapilli TaxID=436231 RepID=A0ABN2SVS2_9MICO
MQGTIVCLECGMQRGHELADCRRAQPGKLQEGPPEVPSGSKFSFRYRRFVHQVTVRTDGPKKYLELVALSHQEFEG